jgi:hypothetical protein
MRAQAVQRLLQQGNLSPWAKQYWERVLRELSRNEDVYNWRVKNVYTQMRNQYTKGWLE